MGNEANTDCAGVRVRGKNESSRKNRKNRMGFGRCGFKLGNIAPVIRYYGVCGFGARWRTGTNARVFTFHTAGFARRGKPAGGDRKSTRLNSSHVRISYAVFCLKKKNKRT